MARSNDAVAAALQEFADLLAITGGDPYRVRSYEKAARSVALYHREVDELDLKGLMACGCRESSSIVSCGDLVLVDETAESVMLANRAEVDAVGRLDRYGLAGGALIKGAVRSMGVVVLDVDL